MTFPVRLHGPTRMGWYRNTTAGWTGTHGDPAVPHPRVFFGAILRQGKRIENAFQPRDLAVARHRTTSHPGRNRQQARLYVLESLCYCTARLLSICDD